ncbi:hypothetical protein A1Q1_07046 [Trichosporon asahii var. asahii CBS 2479]|uniref:Uncharacterized protein n=1 Tax=Trichosporon asahii var. asahii (strain ATCC 90039 / CBS 2479 / JCM 2466 / KCTC 7840 / NBRC 103889/ NCYC 2677 / UAMH 7654) TaxID=1186058 RepID=J6F3R9_TRIAS|nr:hypothetical protein A1Q1_07046 [Trichosporon asahii var. asahii CBS 2479]EJT51634.1 hypothetical protein A1Q1_07046 [Trichosporon asahii var. asahii CBS 2479]
MPFTVRGSELELPLDDLIFSPVVLWIDSMRQDKVQEDAVLQGAVSSIVNMAKGAIVRKSKATLANYAGSNMDNIFVGARSASDSSAASVRVPDIMIVLRPETDAHKRLVLLAGEVKAFEKPKDKATRFQQGMGQCLLYLIQSNEWCGTYLGLFVLSSQFSRMYIPHHGEIMVEMRSRAGTTMTVSQFCQASGLEDQMPHDMLDGPDLNDEELRVLWDFIALVRRIAAAMPDPLPDTVPRADVPLGQDQSVCLDPNDPTSLVALMELAAKAHPREFPAWWTIVKRELLREGSDDPVPPDTYRKRQKRSVEAPAPSGDGHPTTGGAGKAAVEDGVDVAATVGREEEEEREEEAEEAEEAKEVEVAGQTTETPTTAIKTKARGTSTHGRATKPPNGVPPDPARVINDVPGDPNENFASSAAVTPDPSTPPLSDVDDDGASFHTRRWVHQIRSMSAPETPGPSPERPIRLYSPEELFGESPEPSTILHEPAPFDEDAIAFLMVELQGWTVRLVSSATMDAAISAATAFTT